ncbi:metal transporter [Arenibacter palladensis]|uniref:metal transporter n=1 Tax=Arenibacter palladensis TaxID=237373 RepID=UPI002FD2C0A9
MGEVRKSFHQLSDIMIRLEITFDANDKTLYVMHCTMVNNNKGADWFSTSKEIKNPYYGQAMLTCGEVTKEIK